MSKITTGQMFEQWEQMNQKLEALDNKIDGIIDGTTPANTQLTGSSAELLKSHSINGNQIVAYDIRFGNNYSASDSSIPLDISGYKRSSIYIKNNLDRGVDLYVEFTKNKTSGFSNILFSIPKITLASGANVYISPLTYKDMDTFGIGLILKMRVTQLRPEGDVEVVFYGGERY